MAVAAYGDWAPGYICTDKAFEEGGYDLTDTGVGPGSEPLMKAAIFNLLVRQVSGSRPECWPFAKKNKPLAENAMHNMLFLMSAAILLAPGADGALEPWASKAHPGDVANSHVEDITKSGTSTSWSTAARWTARTAGRRWAAG